MACPRLPGLVPSQSIQHGEKERKDLLQVEMCPRQRPSAESEPEPWQPGGWGPTGCCLSGGKAGSFPVPEDASIGLPLLPQGSSSGSSRDASLGRERPIVQSWPVLWGR